MMPEPPSPIRPAAGVPPAAPAAPPLDFPRELRFIFVQLLFSLTMTEIARETADLILHGYEFWEASPAYAHLLLATAVVITSWVGWTMSAAGRCLRVAKVFSWEFVILLVDVLLVLFYFILVRGVEMPKAGEQLMPSASNEARTIGLIFIFYFVWDVLTKAVVSEEGAASTFFRRLVSGRMKERGWSSFVCMLLGGLAWLCLSDATGRIRVVLVDTSLLFLVLLFRAWKERGWNGNRGAITILFLVAAIGFGMAAFWVC